MRFGCQLGSMFASKITQNHLLEASWGVFGRFVGVLAASWAVLEASWRRLELCWSGLECFRGRLGTPEATLEKRLRRLGLSGEAEGGFSGQPQKRARIPGSYLLIRD